MCECFFFCGTSSSMTEGADLQGQLTHRLNSPLEVSKYFVFNY